MLLQVRSVSEMCRQCVLQLRISCLLKNSLPFLRLVLFKPQVLDSLFQPALLYLIKDIYMLGLPQIYQTSCWRRNWLNCRLFSLFPIWLLWAWWLPCLFGTSYQPNIPRISGRYYYQGLQITSPPSLTISHNYGLQYANIPVLALTSKISLFSIPNCSQISYLTASGFALYISHLLRTVMIFRLFKTASSKLVTV